MAARLRGRDVGAELWIRRGRPPGDNLHDWYEAEHLIKERSERGAQRNGEWLAAYLWHLYGRPVGRDLEFWPLDGISHSSKEKPPYGPIELTPEQLEREVLRLFQASVWGELRQLSVENHAILHGADGDYDIDVTVRFEAFGAKSLVLVECEHHKLPIRRDIIQVLADRIRSTGIDKAIAFATNGFQREAVEYAALRRHRARADGSVSTAGLGHRSSHVSSYPRRSLRRTRYCASADRCTACHLRS